MGNDADKLKFTALKLPGEDSGNQSGERSKPTTRFMPDWKLAVHDGLLSYFLHAGRWLKHKRVSGSW